MMHWFTTSKPEEDTRIIDLERALEEQADKRRETIREIIELIRVQDSADLANLGK